MYKRDMEQFLLGATYSDTNGRSFASAVQHVCALSDNAFLSVRVRFSGPRMSNRMCPRRPVCGLFLLQLQFVLSRSGSAPSYNRDGLFLPRSGVRASCSG